METKDVSHLIFMKTYITFYDVGMLQLDKLMELPVNSLLSKSGAPTSISSHDNAFPPLGTGSRRLVLPALARNVPPGHPARQRSSYHTPPLWRQISGLRQHSKSLQIRVNSASQRSHWFHRSVMCTCLYRKIYFDENFPEMIFIAKRLYVWVVMRDLADILPSRNKVTSAKPTHLISRWKR